MGPGGFERAQNIGHGWHKVARPKIDEVASIPDQGFTRVLPPHRQPVIGNEVTIFSSSCWRASAQASFGACYLTDRFKLNGNYWPKSLG